MSRTSKGSKLTRYEYQGKRKGGSRVNRRTSNKMQRMFDKECLRKNVNESLQEMELIVDLSNDVVFKSLFPNAKSITCFNDLLFGYSPVIVDKVYKCDMSDVDELLSFQYHTSCSYTDYNDLHEQYFDSLLEHRKVGIYLRDVV